MIADRYIHLTAAGVPVEETDVRGRTLLVGRGCVLADAEAARLGIRQDAQGRLLLPECDAPEEPLAFAVPDYLQEEETLRCAARTRSGARCRHACAEGSEYCRQHGGGGA